MNSVKQEKTRILGIETSCDETSAAIVEDGRIILSNIVASQVDLHAQYGGIFPEVASRQHVRMIYPTVDHALSQAHLGIGDIDAIAVTRGPGLPGSLVVGMNMAKGLKIASDLPLLGINHLEGHIYSSWLDWSPVNENQEKRIAIKSEPQFPLLVLIVSGGHTELVLVEQHLVYHRLGATLDDAAGEAFDKVARLLALDYPGGPSIQKAAENGNPRAFDFPRSWLDGSWDFSFSGLKSSVLRKVKELEKFQLNLPVSDLAASFQQAVIDVLVGKTLKAFQEFKASEILIAGGVSANKQLRATMLAQADCPVHIPPISLCTDNAAMVASAGYFRYISGQRDSLDMDVLPNWPLSEV